MKFKIKMKKVLKNFENQKRIRYKNIDNNLDVNLLNTIKQTKNLLLKIYENVI